MNCFGTTQTRSKLFLTAVYCWNRRNKLNESRGCAHIKELRRCEHSFKTTNNKNQQLHTKHLCSCRLQTGTSTVVRRKSGPPTARWLTSLFTSLPAGTNVAHGTTQPTLNKHRHRWDITHLGAPSIHTGDSPASQTDLIPHNWFRRGC